MNLPVEIETRWSSLNHRWSVPICLLYSCEWHTVYIHISYIYIYYVRLYIYIYIISYLYNDAWYFLWGPSFLSSSIPLLNGLLSPPGQVHEGGTARPGKLLRRDGIRADEGGVAGFQLLLLMGFHGCWFVGVEGWIGKSTIFNNPTVGIEGLTLSLFLNPFFRVVGVGAIYEVNWGVHEICRSFRYHVDKGSGVHSGMALLYDVFPRTFGWPSRARYFCVTTWFDCEQFARSSPHFPSFHVFTWPNCFRQTRSTAWRKSLWSCKGADCRLKSVAWILWCCWQVGVCQNTSCLLRYIWSHYQLESVQVHFVHQLCLTKKQPLIFRGENHSCGFPSVTTSEWFWPLIGAGKLGDLVHSSGHQMVMAVVKGQPACFFF